MKALTLSLTIALFATTAQAGSYSYYTQSNPYSDYSTVTEYGPNGTQSYQIKRDRYGSGTTINNYGTGESWNIRRINPYTSGVTVDYYGGNRSNSWDW
jgi:hypothetical protein